MVIKVDKPRPVNFGTYSIRQWAHLEGITFDEALQAMMKMDTEQTVRMLYCGFLYGAMKEKSEVDFTEETVWMWIDDYPEFVAETMKVFIDSFSKGESKKKSK